MPFSITIQPDRQHYSAEPGETILEAALRQGLTLPHGCRDGVCGACRGRILEGGVDHRQTSFAILGESERQAGFALFCRATPLSDLCIERRIPDSSSVPPPRALPARVERLTLAAPDVMIVELKTPGSEPFRFRAGQYVDILADDGRRRAFSLANAPEAGGPLQLHIRRQPGGRFTEHVFSTLKARDLLRLHGPHGSFHLREEVDRPAVLVAGGTGFAPIMSIVDSAIARRISLPLRIYWGGRRPADLYLLDKALDWAARQRHIEFIPVLSEPADGDRWSGRGGLVHRAAMQDLPDLSGHQAYVCGSPALVAAARRDFVAQCGLPPDEFFADAFVTGGDSPAS